MDIEIKNIRVLNRARKEFPHIEELMGSIKKLGLLHPVVVHDDEDGKVTLLAGECRLRACLMLGWSKIPTTTRLGLDDKTKTLIELEENLRREDLSWTERAELMLRLDQGKRDELGSASKGNPDGHSMAKLAAFTGQSVSHAAQQVQFAKMMNDRPDIADRVKTLPFHAAFKKFKHLVKSEDMERQALAGLIEVDNDLRLGDALDLIKDIPTNSIDCIVTDPPYGIENLQSTKTSKSTSSSPTVYKMMLEDGDNSTMAGVTALMEELMPELARVLKPGGHMYMFLCNEMYPVLIKLMRDNGFLPSPVPIIWNKMRSTHPFNGYCYCASYEPILFAQLGSKDRRLNSAKSDIINIKPVSTNDRIHPFAKPLDLLQILIEQSTYKGQVVLDPFAGSAATLRAAKRCGRSCIGFEKSNEHYQLAQSLLIKEL